jgi:hypothetical protein
MSGKTISRNGHTIELKSGRWYVDGVEYPSGIDAKQAFRALANPKRYTPKSFGNWKRK